MSGVRLALPPAIQRRLPMWLAPLLAGCAYGLDLGRATTLGAGETRWSGGAELTTITAVPTSEDAAGIPWLQLEGGWHRGFTPAVEAGARVWGFGYPYWFTTTGAAADVKIQVHRSAFRGDPHLALGASLGWHRPSLGGQPWQVGGLEVPLFVGYDLGRSQLVLTPRLGAWVGGGYGMRTLVTGSGGLGIGVACPVGERWELTPELLWEWSPIGFDGVVRDGEHVGLTGFQGGLTLSRTGGR